jgi:hypothetical protein
MKENIMGKGSMSLRVFLVFLIYIMFLQLNVGIVYGGSVEIMPLSDVKVGMDGVGWTVVKGTTIEEFEVEVLGILSSNNGTRGLILVEVKGPLIERLKGITLGMSGSPIYIDGKLIGGLGYKYSASQGTIGLVTPIEDMLEILDYPIDNTVLLVEEYDVPGEIQPVAVPIMVSGLHSARAYKVMDSELRPLDMDLVSVGGLGTIDMSSSVEPGSSIAVQLMRGDVNVFMLGTVTYVDGNDILAFGHSVMHKGQTNYLATGAYVHTTALGDESYMKIVSPTNVIGTVTQDRMAGIAVVQGVDPTLVSARLNVFANDIKKFREISVEIVQDDSMLSGLLTTAFLNGIDATFDKIGAGTAHVSFEIVADGINVIQRENVFFSNSDITLVSITEILECVSLLLNNDFQDVKIRKINADITVESVRRTAVVEEILLDDSVIKPGDTLVAKVLLRSYRGEPWFETIKISIPDYMPSGYAVLTVQGGNSYVVERTFDYEMLEHDLEGIEQDGIAGANMGGKNLETAINSFLSREKNNELVASVVVYSSAYDNGHGTFDDDFLFSDSHTASSDMHEDGFYEEQTNDVLKLSIPTEYVLQGWKNVEFEIGTPKNYNEDCVETEEIDEMELPSEEDVPLGLGTLHQVDSE